MQGSFMRTLFFFPLAWSPPKEGLTAPRTQAHGVWQTWQLLPGMTHTSWPLAAQLGHRTPGICTQFGLLVAGHLRPF